MMEKIYCLSNGKNYLVCEKKVSKPDDSKANNVSKLKNSKDEDMQQVINP